jgi:hypothetical protein
MARKMIEARKDKTVYPDMVMNPVLIEGLVKRIETTESDLSRLAAENVALKAALNDIAAWDFHADGPQRGSQAHSMRIARRALSTPASSHVEKLEARLRAADELADAAEKMQAAALDNGGGLKLFDDALRAFRESEGA